jgi:glycosyltransferase involved in cell wall biosynthesis
MRMVLWHGWLLEGTGSNIYTAKVAEVWRRAGHQVLLICQQPRPERLGFVDAWGEVDADGPSRLTETGVPRAAGRAVVLRPRIGSLLPVFVVDRYEGFEVKRFVDLSEDELEGYLEANAAALRAALEWHGADVVVAGHAVPGAPVALRGLGPGAYAAKIHGSDLEYAIRVQSRYQRLAAEGLAGSVAVTGASRNVLSRTVELVPEANGKTHVVPPGVELDRWRPRLRADAAADAATPLDADPDLGRGRPSGLDERARELLAARDGAGLDALATAYDQAAPDPDAPRRIRALAGERGPIIGYLGKLIPQKGVERILEALALLGPGVRGLVVGYGTGREWLTALLAALDLGDGDAHVWLEQASELVLELEPDEVGAASGLGSSVSFTGRLDHRYAPQAVAMMDVLVVPSTLGEAFGMVAAEGAAAGAVPVVARHSALAEVALALEGAVGRPGLLSFEPGPGATRRLAEALRRLVELPPDELARLRAAARAHVAAEWTWERTGARLLEVATR